MLPLLTVLSEVVTVGLCTQEANRPIRYPAKIAPNLKELMAGVDAILQGLQQMLQQHVTTAAKQLRVQVR